MRSVLVVVIDRLKDVVVLDKRYGGCVSGVGDGCQVWECGCAT